LLRRFDFLGQHRRDDRAQHVLQAAERDSGACEVLMCGAVVHPAKVARPPKSSTESWISSTFSALTLLLVSVTLTPPAGAAAFSVTVPVLAVPPVTAVDSP
jgi:hypothetical protein